MSKNRFKVQFIVLIAFSVIFCTVFSGCGSSRESQTAAQETIDQLEESLRYNYASSYSKEANAFSLLSAEMTECDPGDSSEIAYVKGMIHGIAAEKIYPVYKSAYDLSIDKMQEPRIADDMRKSAEAFLGDFWNYVVTLDSLMDDALVQLLKDETFTSLNKQLQETIDQHLTIDISTDSENLQKRFRENAGKACELVSQLEETIQTR